jgi:hypothetical protein
MLRQSIYKQIDQEFSFPNAVSGDPDDIYQTLAQPICIPEREDALVTLLFDPITSSQ